MRPADLHDPFGQMVLAWLHWTPGPGQAPRLDVDQHGRTPGRVKVPLVAAGVGRPIVAWRRLEQGRTVLTFLPDGTAGWTALSVAYPFELPWGLVVPGGLRRAA